MKTETKTLTVIPEAHRAVWVDSSHAGLTKTQLASAFILDASKRFNSGKLKLATLLKEVGK